MSIPSIRKHWRKMVAPAAIALSLGATVTPALAAETQPDNRGWVEGVARGVDAVLKGLDMPLIYEHVYDNSVELNAEGMAYGQSCTLQAARDTLLNDYVTVKQPVETDAVAYQMLTQMLQDGPFQTLTKQVVIKSATECANEFLSAEDQVVANITLPPAIGSTLPSDSDEYLTGYESGIEGQRFQFYYQTERMYDFTAPEDRTPRMKQGADDGIQCLADKLQAAAEANGEIAVGDLYNYDNPAPYNALINQTARTCVDEARLNPLPPVP